MNFFDLHCDTPYECYKSGASFLTNDLAVSGEKGKVFNNWHQCFAIWIKDDIPQPYKLYKSILGDFNEKLKSAPGNLMPLLTVEGGAMIEDKLGRVEELKKDNISALTLTWNCENHIASGTKARGGVKPFGRKVIEQLNQHKIACDLSHLNRQSFFDAIEFSDYPIATHSCCDAVFSHPRNLSDDALIAIAEKGGVIGLCLYREFLGGNTFEMFYKHICHILDLGLENNISIGSDFDGCVMENEISNISKIPNLYEFLVQKNLEEKILSKIFFKNAFDFFARL